MPEHSSTSWRERSRSTPHDAPLSATIQRGSIAATRSDLTPLTRPSMAPPGEKSPTLPRLSVSGPEAPGAELELLRTLGEGGMGVVWLARQRSLDREVAVKRVKRDAKGSTGAKDRAAALLDEARATGALEHPSVVPVHALGTDVDGSPILVMKRIEGDSLEHLVHDADHPAWPRLERRYGDRISAIVEILVRVADALELAHARGIVHRDIKPENVMVGTFGEVYLVDWGIALRLGALDERDLSTIGIVGTPAFMAPEMARGDARAIDARTDVYLLGATLHAAITGRPRHDGDSLTKVLLASLTSAPVTYPAELAELGAVANVATRAQPEHRHPTASAFREALTDYLRHRGSRRLSREAARRIDDLGHDPSPERLATPEASRALTEARFALTQALREWSDNAEARALLDRVLGWSIEAELFRRSPDGAEAMAADLSTPDPSLTARIAALRAEVLEARRLEEEARHERHERDPRASARQRAWMMIILIAVTLVLVPLGWRSEQAGGGVRSMSEVMTYDLVLTLVAGVMLAIFRGGFLTNRVGRQTMRVIVAILGAQLLSDGIFWARDGDPRHAGAFSLLSMAGVLAGAGIGIDPRFFVPGAAFLAGAVVCGLMPSLTIPAIGGAALVAFATVLFDAWAQLRKRPA